MADQTLQVQAGSLPSGFCPADYQSMLNGFSAVQTVVIPSGSDVTVIASATQPSDTTAYWIQLDSLGRPVRAYYFAQGAWLSKHPLEPGMTMIWTTALPTFTTFDGGDADPLSAISGPMWEVVTAFEARMPLGVGTLPISGTVLAVGDTGGLERVSLTTAEMPPHDHDFTVIAKAAGPSGAGALTGGDDDTANDGEFEGTTTEVGGTGSPAVVSSHQNLPPYLAVYMLRRTARAFYSVT